jgi:hypothetical protein
MRNSNRFKSGIVAVVGAGLLAVIPTNASAVGQQRWDICPALDTEPVCDLVAQTASNGHGVRPATHVPSPRSSNTSRGDFSCPSGPGIVIVACAG